MPTLIYLPNHQPTLRTLATWIYDEWLRSDPNASIERITAILAARAESTQVPLSIVALDEQGRPLGIANLTASDMSRTDLAPWLSGVYVAPEARNRGVGSALCRRIEIEARRLGIPVLYLFTKDGQRLYSRLGWQVRSVEQYKGSEVTVMELRLPNGSALG